VPENYQSCECAFNAGSDFCAYTMGETLKIESAETADRLESVAARLECFVVANGLDWGRFRTAKGTPDQASEVLEQAFSKLPHELSHLHDWFLLGIYVFQIALWVSESRNPADIKSEVRSFCRSLSVDSESVNEVITLIEDQGKRESADFLKTAREIFRRSAMLVDVDRITDAHQPREELDRIPSRRDCLIAGLAHFRNAQGTPEGSRLENYPQSVRRFVVSEAGVLDDEITDTIERVFSQIQPELVYLRVWFKIGPWVMRTAMCPRHQQELFDQLIQELQRTMDRLLGKDDSAELVLLIREYRKEEREEALDKAIRLLMQCAEQVAITEVDKKAILVTAVVSNEPSESPKSRESYKARQTFVSVVIRRIRYSTVIDRLRTQVANWFRRRSAADPLIEKQRLKNRQKAQAKKKKNRRHNNTKT
jgi:hypothetical protein